jgi:hypothetical protein
MKNIKVKISNQDQSSNVKKNDLKKRTAKNYTCNIHLIFDIWYMTLLIFISCCGYSTRSLLPEYIQKVHVKIFENRTVKAGLDELATNTVIEAFRSGSNLRIVDEKSADIIIEGTVSGFSKDPHTYTSDQTIIDYKITIKFTVRCIDRVKNEIFWEGDVSEWTTYSSNENEGINEAVEKTAERLVTTILTNW